MSQRPYDADYLQFAKDNSELKYKNNSQSESYVNSVLSCGSINSTLSGAGRYTTNSATLAALPSEDAVDEMRDWSIECKL